MKVIAVLVLLVAVIGVSVAAPNKKCNNACPFNYAPVCAGPEAGADKPLSFGNECVLNNYNCEKNLREFAFDLF